MPLYRRRQAVTGGAREATDLFQLIDEAKLGFICEEDFALGCLRLRGLALRLSPPVTACNRLVAPSRPNIPQSEVASVGVLADLDRGLGRVWRRNR